MMYNKVLAGGIIALFGIMLTGCGGGGVSTGAAGGGSSGSSSIVVQMARGSASIMQEQQGNTSLAEEISDMVLRKALAYTADVTVYLYANSMTPTILQTTTTDASGDAVFSVAPGTYYVCFADTTIVTDPTTDTTNCVQVVVGSGEIVTITGVDTSGATLAYTSIEATVADTTNIASFQDPTNPAKTIVCHRGYITLSVGTPAALYGHLAHGDTLGACPGGGITTGATNSGSHGFQIPTHGNSVNHPNNGKHNGQST